MKNGSYDGIIERLLRVFLIGYCEDKMEERLLAPLYIALLHYPVCNREGEIITTAITNLDVHDIARLSRSYGIRKYFIVTPFPEQRKLVEKIKEHWILGYGKKRIPERGEAMKVVEVVSSYEEVLERIKEIEGDSPVVVATSAKQYPEANSISYGELRKLLERREKIFLLLFGTGWGLAKEVILGADYILKPVRAKWGDGYNHLSVRSAASIIVDRLLGEKID